MRGDGSADGAAFFLRLARPQVLCGIAAFIFGEAHARGLYGDSLRFTAGVEQTNNRVSVRFHLGEHLPGTRIENPFSSDRILVNSEDCGVFKVFQIQWVEVSKIDSED